VTRPLHHINQFYMNLPALNGFTAAHAQAGEEALRQQRLERARELHRDKVERVTELSETIRVNPIHPDPGDRNRARYDPKFRKRKGKAEKAQDPYLAPAEQVIDRRV
jgi:hypothetical protein